ncbi:MAG: redoxin domain-containing protein [Phenylobacterium sp.]|uniref:peroxiredoxin family protein n=1 Tax=Phenylobacterium sp. TaxID=1871053 RepID=UPI0025EE7452|nr:peroxiredoxin family protein [Phenylobacterium sp.]MBI1197114.1 redoxin domain-containing protein [Phenylobacterium sp.]
MRIDRRRLMATATAFALLAPAARADAPFGPKVGTRAPEVGALADQNGAPRTLTELAGPKGVVLMFYRSAGWCPFCQAQLMAMNAGAAEIESRGYRIVGVSYDDPEVTKAFTQRRGITYPLLSDKGSVVIDRWGLRDPQYAAGSRAYGVPRPAIFVIDRAGVIRASLAEETYQKRPPVSEVVKALDMIG